MTIQSGKIQDKRLVSKGVEKFTYKGLMLTKQTKAYYNCFIAQQFSSEEVDEKVKEYADHSLRAGFATTADMMRVPEHAIMRQMGHKKSDTLKKYIRMGMRFEQNSSGKWRL
ncbi:MAG: hypothetical protein K0S74_230 [Chlamydiales bacterium]|nr:hypothetical protein [Chlamydiales bacterium]